MFLKSHFYEKTSCYSIFAPLFPSAKLITEALKIFLKAAEVGI